MPLAADDSLAVLVSDRWLDEFCEQVGSLTAVLHALTRTAGHDRPHTLAVEALDNCLALQQLLNAIPVWGGHTASPHTILSPNTSVLTRPAVVSQPHASVAKPAETCSSTPLGDCFPAFSATDEEGLPVLDVEGVTGGDAAQLLESLQKFGLRAEGDLRELELLSVGHDWTRLTRLAGVLKDAAARVSAARIVVDAAALQGAARIGCRNDVDLALDALRADLRACQYQVSEWLQTGIAEAAV